MPEEELDLLQFTARIMAEPRAGPSKIVWRKPWDLHPAAAFLTTCQTVFSEMPCPQSFYPPDRHIGIADRL
jgi:hypothetical protein